MEKPRSSVPAAYPVVDAVGATLTTMNDGGLRVQRPSGDLAAGATKPAAAGQREDRPHRRLPLQIVFGALDRPADEAGRGEPELPACDHDQVICSCRVHGGWHAIDEAAPAGDSVLQR
jgi:hypothetical protein